MRPTRFNIEQLLARYPHRDRASLMRMSRWTNGIDLSLDVDSDAWKEWASDQPPPAPTITPPKVGPGDVVKAVLKSLGYEAGPNCGCEKMRRQMNEWGWWGCWRHRAELLAWFKAKGKERGVELTTLGLFRELRRAWKERVTSPS